MQRFTLSLRRMNAGGGRHRLGGLHRDTNECCKKRAWNPRFVLFLKKLFN